MKDLKHNFWINLTVFISMLCMNALWQSTFVYVLWNNVIASVVEVGHLSCKLSILACLCFNAMKALKFKGFEWWDNKKSDKDAL